MKSINKSSKLDNVLYDIRGPVMEEAKRLEEEGYHIMKLNIGNPAPLDWKPQTKLYMMLSTMYAGRRATPIPRHLSRKEGHYAVLPAEEY